mgnify:CR=1 FL=1
MAFACETDRVSTRAVGTVNDPARKLHGRDPRRSGVFDALLPGWSSPARVAAVLLAWFLVDATLVVLVARRGRLSLALAVALLSTGGALVVVRTHDGRTLGNAALLARLALLVVAGAAVRDGSRSRLLALVGALVVSLVCFVPIVVLFGEATVAP